MMAMPIYLNQPLIQDLYSVLIDGYLQSTSIKYITDKTDIIKLQKGMENLSRKEQTYSKKRNKFHNKERAMCNKDKEKLSLKSNCIHNKCNCSGSLDDKNTNIREFGVTKLYTTFHLLYNLREMMMSKNMIKQITEEDIINNKIKCGDYVEFEANIDTLCLYSQLNTLIDIMECYDTRSLDNLIIQKRTDDKKQYMNNYTVMLKQLKNLNEYLNKNDTRDMIVRLKNCSGVLSLNINNFSQESAYMYDAAYCNCKILCKVVKTIGNKDKIDLLRKTGMSSYYNKFLKSLNPYLSILNENDIITLNNITTTINGPAIQGLPIAIYV